MRDVEWMSVILKSFSSPSHAQFAATDLLLTVTYSTYIGGGFRLSFLKVRNNFEVL